MRNRPKDLFAVFYITVSSYKNSESNRLNNFAISSDGIASGLQRSASTLVAAGNSLEQSIAMLAAGNKVIQDPETLGNALKVLSMRIRGVKSDLEDAGEETDGMIENTSKLRDKVKALTNVNGNGGVDILTESGAFRSTYDILLDIAKVWDQINEADPQNQAALLEILAGKTRGSQVAAILQNPKDLEAAYATAMNSAGSAMAENEKYLDSIQGRIDLFTNSLQTMWMNFINSDALKFIIDLGTAIIKFTDSMGLIPTAVGAFTIFKTTASDIKKSFDELSKSPEKVLNIFKTTAEDAAEAKEIQAEATIQAAEANQIEGQMSFFSAEANQQEANSTNASTISKTAETVETIKNTAATKANIAITKALNVVKSMGKGLLIGLAVSAATSLIGKLISSISEASKRMEELTDNAIKSADEIDSTRKSVEEYKNSIEELRAKLADSTISEQEAYDARAQLIDIQNQLIDKFGLEAEGINLVTGAIEDQISAIDELQRKSAEDWLADNNEAYQNAIKEMDKTYSNNKFIISSESGTITRTTDQYGQVTENREITSQTLGSVSDEIRDAYNKGLKKIIEDAGGEIKESLNGGDYGGTNYYNKNFTASFENKTVEELDAVFRDMQSFLIQFQKDNGVDLNARITQLEQLRKDIVDEDYIDARELYNKGRQQEAVATYGAEYGAILDAQEKFYNSTNDEDRLAAITEYERAIATAEQAATDAGQEHMQDFFAEMHNKFSKEEFELKIKTDEDGLKTKLEGIVKAGGESGLAALDDNQIKDMISKGLTNPEYHAGIYTNTYGYTQAQVKGLVDLQAAADTAGISVEDLISVLVNLGLIAGRPAEKAAESVESVGQAYSILAASAEKYASINDILNESIYDNIAISEEQYDALKDLVGSEEEFADCIDTSNGYVVKNTSLLKKLVAEKKKAQAADVKLAKSQTRLEYVKLIKQLTNTLNVTKDLNDETKESARNTLDQANAVKIAMYQYQLLEDRLLGTTSAFDKFRDAQEIDAMNTYGDDFTEIAQVIYDALYKTGNVGTEEFWAAVEAGIPRIVYAGKEGVAQLEAVANYLNTTLAPMLRLKDDEFSIDYDAAMEFIQKGIDAEAFEGTTDNFVVSDKFLSNLEEGETGLSKLADELNMTEAAVLAFAAAYDKLNGNPNALPLAAQLDTSIEGRIISMTSELEALNKQKLALLEDGGYEKNKAEIDKINTKIQQTGSELNKTGQEAYDMWQKYTENEAALASLEEISKTQENLTKEQAATFGVKWDEENGLTVQQAIDQLLEKKLKLEEPTVLTAQFAVDYIYSEIDRIEALLANPVQLEVEAEKAGQTVREFADELRTELDGLKSDAATIATVFGIELDEDQQKTIKEELEDVEEITIHDKKFKVTATGLSTVVRQMKELVDLAKELEDVDTPSTSKSESTGFYVGSDYHPPGSGGRVALNANGTFHIPNSAFAGGSVGAPRTETSLVGELGPELLVRNGRWTTVGENGAEFTQVKKGDIIFNHKQTEDLLSNGYITNRGKAYASGTAYANPNYSWQPISPDKSLSNDPGNNLSDKDNNGRDDELKDEFEEYFDWIEVKLEEINDSINLNGAKLENAVGASAQNAIIDDMIAGNQELYSTLVTAADAYYSHAQELFDKIPAKYRDAAKYGKTAGDDKLIELFTKDAGEEALNAIQEYREWVQKGDDATQQAEETLAEIRSLAKQAFDNIATDYENQRSLRDNRIDQLESGNALSEAKYGSESTKIYEALVKNNEDNIALLNEQRNAMQANLNAQVRSGDIKKYSQDWYDAVNSIAAVDNEIIELTADTYDYIDAMGEIHWNNLDNVLSRFEAISNEVENLLDILDNKDMVDEAGNWTDEGITSLGLYAQQMEIAEVQAKKYQDEIAYLNKNWKSLGLTEQEYVEKLDELKSGQYDSIKAYHEAKNAIVDLNKTRVDAIKNGIEKEIDAYEELIQKKKEALDADKDLYDFEKSVNEQQKNIATIERKLAALATDNSTSAAAQRKKLEEELIEAKGELEDTFYERSIQNQQNALDKELENFQNSKEEEMEGWDEYLENTEQVVSDSLATIQANTDIVYQTLKSMGQEYGLTIAETLTSPWRDGEAAIQSYAEQFGLSMSSTVEELQKLAIEYEKIMKEIEGFGEEVINRVEQNAQSYVSANNSSSKDNKPSSPSKDTMPSRTPTEQQEETKSITVGGKINAGSARIYANSDGGGGSKQYFSSDPIYVVLGEQNGYLKVRHHSVSSGVTGWFKKSDVKAYAKGTTGVPSDQIAWLDELGEELVMHADGNGRLAFLSKGTSVIPANLTKNLMKLGELNPQDILDRSRPIISAPHIVNNEISIDMSFGSVVNVEHVDNDTLPDLAKTVEQQMDKYMKKLNSEIRKYAR